MRTSLPCSPLRFTPALALVLAFLASAAALRAGPWESLFNGKDLTGWRIVNGTAPYVVEGDTIVGMTKAGSPNSFLATERTFGDFILELDLKQEGGPSNSGIQFRGLSTPGYMSGRVHGYQFELDPGERAWSGGIYDEARRGWLYPVTLNPAARTAYRAGDWNRVRIEAIGDSLRTWLNDQPVSHVIDGMTREGFIALQIHSISNASAAGRRVLFRNLRIQTTDLQPAPPSPVFVRNTTPNALHAVEQAAGWRLLWDGATTTGWAGPHHAAFPTDGWKSESGQWVTVSGAPARPIATTTTFSAFEFQFEFNVPSGGRGAVKYWVPAPTDGSGPAHSGPAYVLADPVAKSADEKTTSGSLAGLIARGKMPGGAAIVPKAGEWQQGRIVARADGKVEHWLNGVQVVTFDRDSAAWTALGLGASPRGALMLDDTAGGTRFRSLKVRELK